MLTYFWIMLGGALGTGARFWASGFIAENFGEVFPLGTLFVNVTGSFVIGFFAGLIDPSRALLNRAAPAAVCYDRCLRRLHHFLILQPADP